MRTTAEVCARARVLNTRARMFSLAHALRLRRGASSVQKRGDLGMILYLEPAGVSRQCTSSLTTSAWDCTGRAPLLRRQLRSCCYESRADPSGTCVVGVQVEAEANTDSRPIPGFIPRRGAGLPIFGKSATYPPAGPVSATLQFAVNRNV